MSWRVRHQGRDAIYYEELVDGQWTGFELGGEMLLGRAHHAIDFGSRDAWNTRPAWARGRRDEIIARVKSACPMPDYEYNGEGVLDETDRERLIALAGGLSASECGWYGCQERALNGKRLCVRHCYRDAW
jgi:hypothetical protein